MLVTQFKGNTYILCERLGCSKVRSPHVSTKFSSDSQNKTNKTLRIFSDFKTGEDDILKQPLGTLTYDISSLLPFCIVPVNIYILRYCRIHCQIGFAVIGFLSCLELIIL